jgi:predicted ribosomally synthesized peptide with SipW-like signal peptide
MNLSKLLGNKRALAFGSLALATVSLTSGVTSLALFTDSQDVNSNSFTTGTIDISVSPTSAFFSIPNMMPGDDFTRFVTVTNSGTSQLRYDITSVTGTGSAALRSALDVEIGVMNSTACTTWDGTSPAATGDLDSIAYLDQTLNASANVGLCFRAELPLASGNSLQGLTAGTTFRFAAEQTANNP